MAELTEALRALTGEAKWLLIQKGDLDRGQRGVWRVTEQGRRRAEGSPEQT